MKIFKFGILIALISAALIFLSSCKIKEYVPGFSDIGNTAPEVYEKIIASESDYETISMKVGGKLTAFGSKFNVKGTVRIKKDSIIWISLNPLGLKIEMARVVFEPDSFRFLNRMSKTYFAGDYKYFSKSLNVDVTYLDIQSILTNNFFAYNYSDFTREILALEQFSDSNYKLIIPSHREKVNDYIRDIYQEFLIDKCSCRINSVLIKDDVFNSSIKIDYTEFKDFEIGVFPSKLNIEVLGQKNLILYEMDYNKIHKIKETRFPFKVPKKYERIQ